MEQKIFCLEAYYKSTSFKIVQAMTKKKLSFNTFSNSQKFKLVKNFEFHSICEDSRVTGFLPSGSPKILIPHNFTRVEESANRSPSKSLYWRSQELGHLCLLQDAFLLRIWNFIPTGSRKSID